MSKIKHTEFHCRMIAYNEPVAYNKTFVQVCGNKIKDSIGKRCLRRRHLKGKEKWRNKEKSRNGRARPSCVRVPLIGHYRVAASLCSALSQSYENDFLFS